MVKPVATRKAALVGCARGPWVSCADMAQVFAHVVAPEGTEVWAAFSDASQPSEDNETGQYFNVGPGCHKIHSARWVRLAVLSGDPERVLVTLISRKVA